MCAPTQPQSWLRVRRRGSVETPLNSSQLPEKKYWMRNKTAARAPGVGAWRQLLVIVRRPAGGSEDRRVQDADTNLQCTSDFPELVLDVARVLAHHIRPPSAMCFQHPNPKPIQNGELVTPSDRNRLESLHARVVRDTAWSLCWSGLNTGTDSAANPCPYEANALKAARCAWWGRGRQRAGGERAAGAVRGGAGGHGAGGAAARPGRGLPLVRQRRQHRQVARRRLAALCRAHRQIYRWCPPPPLPHSPLWRRCLGTTNTWFGAANPCEAVCKHRCLITQNLYGCS